MALIICKECGEQISSEAACCPKCGCPVSAKKQKKKSRKLLIIIPIVLILCAGFFKYAVDEHLIFLSAESKMDYYFNRTCMDNSEENIEAAIEYFNSKFSGTENETAAVDMLKDTIINHHAYSEPLVYTFDHIVDGLDTDNADVEILREVTDFLISIPSIYDIQNSPSQFYGETVAVSSTLQGVDVDRKSVKLNGAASIFECIYDDVVYIGADWENNRNRSGGNVLAYGLVKKYSDSDKAYLQMFTCVDLMDDRHENTNWETITAIYEFKNALEAIGYTVG